MTKKTISYSINNEENVQRCGVHASVDTINSFLSEESRENYINMLTATLLKDESIRNISRATSELVYIPIIFQIAISSSTETLPNENILSVTEQFYENFPEYIGYSQEDINNIIKSNSAEIVNKLNNNFAGQNVLIRSEYLFEDVSTADLSFETRSYISKFNSEGLQNTVSTNIRFFLPYKLPKELIHPFAKYQNAAAIVTPTLTYEEYKERYTGGVTISDSYNSQYTYNDIKTQRELVKSIADGSRSRNTDFEIGDEYGGGYIFQINEDGTGLVVTSESFYENWHDAIIAAQNSTLGGYDDWYLPSIEELALIYNTLQIVNTNGEWSSSESTINGYAFYFLPRTNRAYSNNKSYKKFFRFVRQTSLSSSVPPEVTTLAEMEDDYFFYFGDSPGVILIPILEDALIGFTKKNLNISNDTFQISNIIYKNENRIQRETPIYETWTPTASNTNLQPHANLFSAVPSVKITSKSAAVVSGGLAGYADLGSLSNNKGDSKAFSLKSFSLTSSGNSLANDTSGIIQHELFHQLGYNHSFDGVNISGLVGSKFIGTQVLNSKNKRLSVYYRSGVAVGSSTTYTSFYAGFSPPFKYYDLNDASQILEDENTLPDFEIIDPKEKLFVESAIKTVQNIYAGMDKSLLPYADDNFTGFAYSEDFIETENAHSSFNNGSAYGNLCLQYSKLFGLISHLPSFWGGSYTINENGSKSMLINYRPLQRVGGLTEGGIILKIYDNNTALILALTDFEISYTSDIRPENLINQTQNGYEDWRLPSFDELEEISNLITENNLSILDSSINYLSSTVCQENAISLNNKYYVLNNSSCRPANGSNTASRLVRIATFSEDTMQFAVNSYPNITVYNAVCSKSDPLQVNLKMFFTLEWYDDSYPAFPDNTRVEDMFSPDLCPCLYEDQTVAYKENLLPENPTETVTFKFFTKKINEVSGEEINTTTGNIVSNSEVAQKLMWHYEYFGNNTYLNYNPGGTFKLFVNVMFNSGSNESTNFKEYFGDTSAPPVWLKTVGDIVVPNFPIYIGFVPEGPLPKVFKYNPGILNTSSIDSEESLYKLYSQINYFNDPSQYNHYGENYRSIVDKYFRIGNTDSTSDLYNPFKIDTISGAGSFVTEALTALGYTHEEWQEYNCLLDMTALHSNAGKTQYQINKYNTTNNSSWNTMNRNFIFDKFYSRTDDLESPLLDNFPETLYGPFNSETLINVMYYHKNNTGYNYHGVISNSMAERLEYFVNTASGGPLSIMRQMVLDLYMPENNAVYTDYLPDENQKTKSNTLQLYINDTFDYLKENAVKEEDIVVGCLDPTAFNYNPNATVHGNCEEVVYGCTNIETWNYNPNANTDDGTCDFTEYYPDPVTVIRVCPENTNIPACNNTTSKGFTLFLPSIDYSNFTDVNINNNTLSAFSNYLWGTGGNMYATASDVENNLLPEKLPILENMLNDVTHSGWLDPFMISYLNVYRADFIDDPLCNTPFTNNFYNATGDAAGTPYTFTGPNVNTGGGCVKVADLSVCSFPEIYNNTCNPYAVASTDVNNLLPENSQEVSLQEYINFYNNVSSDPTLSVGVCNNSNTI